MPREQANYSAAVRAAADRDRRGSDTSSMLDNIAGFGEGERTKALKVRLELFLELMPSIPFVSGEFILCQDAEFIAWVGIQIPGLQCHDLLGCRLEKV